MASALIAGLQDSDRGLLEIRVADPSDEARRRILRDTGLEAHAEGRAAAPGADVILLAVKPQVIPAVLEELAPIVEPGQLVLSIAAGTTVSKIKDALGESQPVVRAMPNTPALIGKGISGVFASADCRAHHREQAERILAAAGQVVWISDESLMDAVTAISGSGPAYYFLLTELLATAGAELGIDADDALRLAVCTAEGAGAMMAGGRETPSILRERVTSPGGTTQAALEQFSSDGIDKIVNRAVQAAFLRGRELS